MEKAVLKEKKRISVLDVPIDIVPEEEIEVRVQQLLADEGRHQMVLIDLWGLLRARGNSEYARSIRKASLIIPTSKIIVLAARFLGRKPPVRYMPFDIVIRILGALEKHGQSVYLLGSTPLDLQTATSNLRASFPGIHIVGRCAGFFKRNMELNITLAIRKAAPSLVLAGNGVRGGDSWILSNKKNFSPGISLWCGECFEIFSGKRKKPSRPAWNSGFSTIPELVRKPWRLLRLFPYTMYAFVLLYYRMRNF